MSKNAKLTLISRCSRQNSEGDYIESPLQIFDRVSRHVAKAEINWGTKKDIEGASEEFLERMINFKFICTRGALFEAGNETTSGQLSPCFVLPIDDSIHSIFKTLGEAALIQKNFGGTGFNFSHVRMKGDRVKNVPNAASGPVDFLQVYSAALSKIIQGAKRHGANMGVLNVSHPDIYDFIKVKDEDGNMKNFNVSVGVTDNFMKAVKADEEFNLINPRDSRVVMTVKAKNLFHKICGHAWKSGDPGMLFLDRIEKDNFTPVLGKIEATNPCGEQPLLPYESCNLSSIHLSNHVVQKGGGYEIDWKDLGETVRVSVRFLDDMIEVNHYVLDKTEKIVRFGNRKIGLGVIGFAHLLFKLGVPYNSQEAVKLAEKIAEFIKIKAGRASIRLAKTRGVFPNWDKSIYKNTAMKYRNCTMLTIAPTGTVAMVGDTTSGIEPSFALVYRRNSFYNEDSKNNSTKVLYYVDPILKSVLRKRGLYSRELIKKIDKNGGSLSDLKSVPADLKKVFVTAYQISPEWHVRVQAAFQKYFDNAVSKTINFPNGARVEEVERAYLLSWKLGCKGITVYRDGSKNDQVLSTCVEKVATGEGESKCPECGGKVDYNGNCATCRECGWSKCKL